MLKLVYILVSVFILALNITSFITQALKKGDKKFEVKIISLNFSDSLCGVYLSIIWISDTLFQNRQSMYLINEELWKSHSICFAGSFWVLWFIISSQLLLIYISLTRCFAVLSPLKYTLISLNQILYKLASLYSFSIGISALITMIYYYYESQLPNGLCLPFIDPSGSFNLTKVISWIVIISQSVSSAIIIVVNWKLIYELHKNKMSISKSSTDGSYSSSRKVLTQLTITSISNIICWLPANVVYLSAMILYTYPVDLVIWTTVLIMPINSIINPCIFLSKDIKDKILKA